MKQLIALALTAFVALVSAQSALQTAGAPPQAVAPAQTSPPVAPIVADKSNVSAVSTVSTVSPPATTSTTTTPTTVPTTPTTPKPTIAPTPPPTPRPVPKPESWSGNVTDGNRTCIRAEFSVQIVIKYNATNNTILETGFTIPVNASVDRKQSYCDSNGTQPEGMTISFKDEENTSANLSLIFENKDGNAFARDVVLSFTLTKDLFPQFIDPKQYGQTVTAEKQNLTLFKVASVHSYKCSSAQSAILDSQDKSVNEIQIDFLSSKVEAYISEGNAGKFDSEIDCKSTEISDVVPIAVGAALAGLVVIVLIAYFIGRRRSRRLAYQSV